MTYEINGKQYLVIMVMAFMVKTPVGDVGNCLCAPMICLFMKQSGWRLAYLVSGRPTVTVSVRSVCGGGRTSGLMKLILGQS